jgi:hypothetical protein
LECPAPALAVFKTCPFVDDAVAAGTALPGFDKQLPLLSVPGLMRLAADKIPAPIPYLSADPAAVSEMAQRLHAIKGYRIGIAPRAIGDYPGDTRHDMPASLIQALSSVPDVVLIDLQRPAPDVPIRSDVSSTAPRTVLREGDGLVELTAVLPNLDLVVTADNTLAQLAGATGANVWTYLSAACHWRWTSRGGQTPWYPKMRLIRESASSDRLEALLSSLKTSRLNESA